MTCNLFKNTNLSCEAVAHGSVTMLISGRNITLYGGAYLNSISVKGAQLVKLAAEIDLDYDHKIDIEDFSPPKPEDVLELAQTIRNSKHDVYYIGCLGGYGRTGTVIAALLILLRGYSSEYAIKSVRSHISPRCIETVEQLEFLYKLSSTVTKLNN